MLDLIAALFSIFKQPNQNLQPLEVFPWEDTKVFDLPTIQNDSTTQKAIERYLLDLTNAGLDSKKQGVWIQSDWSTPVSNQGKIPLPAASLTKIATTLAALNKWGAKHQFKTNIYYSGELSNGIISGDLIISGSGDPLFVWEEAISLGNTLTELGITEIQGDILVTDQFYMNFRDQPRTAGKLFKQALDHKQWQPEVTKQYLQMPLETKQPAIEVTGEVEIIPQVPASATLLLRHKSLPLAEILRQMNIYSNNKMAQILADLIGSPRQIAKSSAGIANFPEAEIQLINGSGLGEENRISARAACQMLIAINRLLEKEELNIADLFPTSGRDIVGTVQDRGFPLNTTVKTGTLNTVSALGGVIPTENRGNVYFTIINYGSRIKYFRQQQDQILNELVQTWQISPDKTISVQANNWRLGDPQRNEY